MDLRKTIAELEEQARQFTEAANALRALAGAEATPAKAGRKVAGKKRGRKPGAKAAAKPGRKPGRKPGKAMSPETRAKIAAAQRAAHARRKAAAGK